MSLAILTDVPDLIERKFPDILFHRLLEPPGSIRLANDPKFPDHKEVEVGGSEGETTRAALDQDHHGCSNLEQHSSNRERKDRPPDQNRKSSLAAPTAPRLPGAIPCPTLEKIWAELSSGDEPLYDVVRKEWLEWPSSGKGWKEGKICTLLNKVLTRARKYVYGSKNGPRERITRVFRVKHNIVSTQANRKPDIVLIPGSGAARWEHVHSAGDLLPRGFCAHQIAEHRLLRHSQAMFGSNPARRFTLLFSLINEMMALFQFDRSGVLISKVFNVHEDPMAFVRVIVGLGLGEDFFLGLDPSFFSKDDKRFVQLNDKSYEIIETLYLRPVVQSRGTVALRVIIDSNTGDQGVIKDQWVNRARLRQEFFWLCLLTKHGARNVSTLIDHQLVRFEIGGKGIMDDETGTDRATALLSEEDGVNIREHRRVLVTPAGEQLSGFKSLRELVSVYRDFAEGIRSIYNAGIYHRDISRHNLIIVRRAGSSVGEGYVIDFDCAASISHLQAGKVRPIGTFPFMAMSILRNNGCPHKFYYDLESLFYTLLWTCLTADGEKDDGYPKPIADFCKTELAIWCDRKMDDPKGEQAVLRQIANNKDMLMTDRDEFVKRILNELHPYFYPIRNMLDRLRWLLDRARESSGPVTMQQILSTDRIFETFILYLSSALENLETRHANSNNNAIENYEKNNNLELTINRQRSGSASNANEAADPPVANLCEEYVPTESRPQLGTKSQKDDDHGVLSENDAKGDFRCNVNGLASKATSLTGTSEATPASISAASQNAVFPEATNCGENTTEEHPQTEKQCTDREDREKLEINSLVAGECLRDTNPAFCKRTAPESRRPFSPSLKRYRRE